MILQSPVLENKRVRLQPLQISDVDALAAIATAEPGLFRFMSQQLHTTGDVYSYIRKATDEYNQGLSMPFLVIDKARSAVAGTTRFGNIVKEHKRLEIGWTWLSENVHRSGLNKAMKFLMLQYAFEKLDMNRVEIKTSETNLISQKAIESIGAIYEGTLRHHMINDDGTLRNTRYYSILKTEWPGIEQRIFQPLKTGW